MTLPEIEAEYLKAKDDPKALNDLSVKLSIYLGYFSKTLAEAEEAEEIETVRIMAQPIIEDNKSKKISKTEAESMAIVNTKNEYGARKLLNIALYNIDERINSRVMTLLNERNFLSKNGGGA